jgi:hypothetical protein
VKQGTQPIAQEVHVRVMHGDDFERDLIQLNYSSHSVAALYRMAV